MSSVHRKFVGLNPHKSTRPEEEISFRGSSCLYSDHVGNYGSHSHRDSKTLACLECSQDILNHKFSLDIERLTPKAQLKAYSFWSNVDIKGIDDCWKWNGELIAKSLYFTWERREIRNIFSFHQILVSIWLSWGDVGRIATESVCGNRRCCNPLHNLPKGLLSTRELFFVDKAKASEQVELLKHQLQEHHHNIHLDEIETASDFILPGTDELVELDGFNQKLFEAQRLIYIEHMLSS